ncbi:hypothetical protein [Ulvibacter antarcticus]|nr:hypothetical protein [Ulvibacter antarcticus]
MNILIFVFLYALKLYKYEIEFSIGWILIHSFFVFFVLPSIIELLILICFFLIRFIVFILIKWKGIGKVETYFKDKEKVIADLDPYINALSVILLIPVIVVIFGSFILLIQFSISTNNPHKLANLECVSSLVKDKFGENQNSKILYFNDKYFFVKIKDPNSDKNDDRIVLFETENILFIDNCR